MINSNSHPLPNPGSGSVLLRTKPVPELLLWTTAILLCLSALSSRAQTYALSNVWTVATNVVGVNNLIVSGDNNRSLAYNAVSNQVLVAARGGGSPAPGIEVLDGSTGGYLGLLDKTGISGGSIAVLSQTRVADDGVIYAANWTAALPSSPVKLYRWSDWLSIPTTAYSGNAVSNTATAGGFSVYGNNRVGDTMAIRGSGTDTKILLPVATSGNVVTTNLILFTTADGTNFSPHILAVTGFAASSSGILGATFYTNNTFLLRLGGSAGNNGLLMQYPANIDSLGAGPIAASQIGSFSLPGVLSTTAFIDYKATGQGGLLALVSPQNAGGVSASHQVALYVDPVLGNGGCPVLQATTNYAHLQSNGNLAGAVALGGSSFNQFIYSLDCNNSVRCSAIITIPPQAPSISSQPVGLGGSGAYAPYTLSVSASGYCPLVYQWQASTNNSSTASTFTNIPGANSTTYSIPGASTNYYRVVVTNSIAPAATSAAVQVAVKASLSNAAVTQLWRVNAGSTISYLDTGNNCRGLAYDTNSDRLAVAYVNSAAVNLIHGTYGTNLGSLSVSGLATGSGAVFNIDQVGIADDGAVYACNLTAAPSGFQNPVVINRWNGPVVAAPPLTGGAYNGVPFGTGERYGDNMAVRGAGANTQILLPSSTSPISGVGPGTNVLLFTTLDGTNFTVTVLGVSGAPAGFANQGIAFGDGNTFWAKNQNGNLYQISFDPSTGAASVLFNYSAVPSGTMGLAVDPALSILATIAQNSTPDDVQLFQLTGGAAPPVLFHQALMSNNANANANAAIAMKNKRLYALDVNNGILALSYNVPVATPPTIATPPSSTTAYSSAAAYFSVAASGTLTLNYQWRSNGVAIPGAIDTTYILANPSLSANGALIDVVVQNTAGVVTSTPPAVLTVKSPASSPTATNLWSMAAGSNPGIPTLDESSYSVRGLAYDATLGRLLVADHFSIYALNATNQAYLESLNTIGVPDVGLSSWVLSQIRVADDGALYACNIQDTYYRPNSFCITRWSTSDSSASLSAAWGGTTGADPGVGDRIGDTMAIRGAGANTQILLGTASSSNVVLFTTVDGLTFTPTVIYVTNAPNGFSSGGVAFGPGANTFWAKGDTGYNLRLATFDLANPGAGSATSVYTAGSQVPSTLVGLGFDAARNILAGVNLDNTPDDLQLFLTSGNSNAPSLIHQAFFASNNANINRNAVVDIKFPWVFALDDNNGIVALNYGNGTPTAPAVTLTAVSRVSGGLSLTWNNVFSGHGYQVQYSTALNPSVWVNLGSPVTPVGETGTYTDTAPGDTARFYRVVSQ